MQGALRALVNDGDVCGELDKNAAAAFWIRCEAVGSAIIVRLSFDEAKN
jgi:hypothetical protein